MHSEAWLLKNNKQRIRPDYTKSFRQVYKDIVLDLARPIRTHAGIVGGNSLDVLVFCATSMSSTNLPNWAPDWRLTIGCYRID